MRPSLQSDVTSEYMESMGRPHNSSTGYFNWVLVRTGWRLRCEGWKTIVTFARLDLCPSGVLKAVIDCPINQN